MCFSSRTSRLPLAGGNNDGPSLRAAQRVAPPARRRPLPPQPSDVEFLLAEQLPPRSAGASDTLFADTERAWAALPRATRDALANRTCEHALARGYGDGRGTGSAAELEALSARFPAVLVPCAPAHPTTHARVLFVSESFTSRIVDDGDFDTSDAESERGEEEWPEGPTTPGAEAGWPCCSAAPATQPAIPAWQRARRVPSRRVHRAEECAERQGARSGRVRRAAGSVER